MSCCSAQPRLPIGDATARANRDRERVGGWYVARSKVYVLWRRLGPPPTLATEPEAFARGCRLRAATHSRRTRRSSGRRAERAGGRSRRRTGGCPRAAPSRSFSTSRRRDGYREHARWGRDRVDRVGRRRRIDSRRGFGSSHERVQRRRRRDGEEWRTGTEAARAGEGDEFLQLWPRRAAAGTPRMR